MTASLSFPRRVFKGAGIYGLIVMLPQYLLEANIGLPLPRPLAYPEHFYGFLGVTVAWQLVFLRIAGDVRRYRELMPLALIEKLGFGLASVALFAAHRIGSDVLFFGLIDLTLGALFVASYRLTPAQGTLSPDPARA
jgi:hypothetical protein